MARDCLVTLDAGTGSGRCVVYDLDGTPLASAREPFAYRSFADPTFPLLRGFDLDPEAFWGVLCRSARAAIAALPPGTRIRGVAATSQREGCVFVDGEGGVLYAGPNVDARGALEGMEVLQRVGAERLHALTGHAPPYIFAVARYCWYRKHHDARRVATILMLNDWITFLLSGVRGAEPSNASESMLYDVRRHAWSAELLAELDVPADVLPPLRAPGARVGVVTPSAARDTGIPDGTPVFVGGADTECALLGSGAWQPGDTAAVIGSTCPVQMVTAGPVFDPQANLWTSCHVVPERWVLESNAGDAGGAYRWLLELLFGAADAGAHAAAEAAMAAVGVDHPVLCYAGPVVFNVKTTNPFRPGGLLFRFPILPVDRPGRGELLRGFLESVAFAIRANCEQIAPVSGQRIASLRASGGLVRSATLVRLLADSLGLPVDVARVPESASLGCAILAAVGAGLHADIPAALAAMVGSARVAPDLARRAEYDLRYAKWRELYAVLEGQTI